MVLAETTMSERSNKRRHLAYDDNPEEATQDSDAVAVAKIWSNTLKEIVKELADVIKSISSSWKEAFVAQSKASVALSKASETGYKEMGGVVNKISDTQYKSQHSSQEHQLKLLAAWKGKWNESNSGSKNHKNYDSDSEDGDEFSC